MIQSRLLFIENYHNNILHAKSNEPYHLKTNIPKG